MKSLSLFFFFSPFLFFCMKRKKKSGKKKKRNEQREGRGWLMWLVHTGYYIRADESTPAGKTMRSQDWGSASSTPPSVNDGICEV